MRRVAHLAVLAVAAPLLALLAPPVHAAENDGVGIRLLDAPVARKDDPRALIYIVDHIKPGTSFSRRIEVSNGTPGAVSLQLYPSAASVDGGWNVAGGRTTNELVEWTTITPASVQLAPGKTAIATVKVDVPANATAGERYAAVLAELPGKSAQSGSVATASRVGIRMYLDVGAGGEPASDFRVDALTARRAADGTPEVTATVTNTGGRAVDLGGTLSLTDGPGGLRAGPVPVENIRTLAVKASGEVLLRLDKSLPDGPWKARIDMESGRIKRSATATITFPKAGAAAPVEATPVGKKKPPWALVAVAGLGLLLLLLVILFLLKRRSRPEDARDRPVTTVRPGQRRTDDEVVPE
jgi:hypothetical protein